MRSLLQAAVLLALSAGLCSLGFSKDIADCLEGLRSWEDAKKAENFVEVTLPDVIEPLSVGRGEAARDFNVGIALFRSSWSDATIAELRSLAVEARQEGLSRKRVEKINPRLKEIRRSLKFLRFLEIALSEDHECPPALDELATSMGKFRDILQGKGGTEDEIPRSAKRLLNALAPRELDKLELELRSFTPSRRGSFDRWVKTTARDTREILAHKKGLAGDFHQARKNLQALLSVYEIEMEFHPENREWEPVALFLLQGTEEIGHQQGVWEREVTAGDLNYKKDTVSYPRELAKPLLSFLKRLKF